MMQARIVEHVYADLWEQHGRPTHPDDVAWHHAYIADVVSRTLAYLDDHAEHQRWVDEANTSQAPE